MEIYTVGGAVRDALLGLPIQDRDYVVIGSTPEAMVVAGFLPVGKDFPVFLHPQTHEEYALARTERKQGHGYKGFSVFAHPSVTLEEDLQRRDLTINAIAQDAQGHLIDPFGGIKDLAAGILRHVSAAFIEDPVRILRVARFAARFGFQVAPETLQLMRQMVDQGELDFLVAERVWQEFAKGLMTREPARMIEILRACGALARLLPEVDALFGVPQRADYHPEIDTGAHTLLALNYAAQQQFTLPVRWAVLLHDVGKACTPAHILPRHFGHESRGVPLVAAIGVRWKVPKDCQRLANFVVANHGLIPQGKRLRSSKLLALLQRGHFLRQPERLTWVLDACESDTRGRLHFEEVPFPARPFWSAALAVVRGVNAQVAIAQASTPAQIPQQIARARLRALRQWRETLPMAV